MCQKKMEFLVLFLSLSAAIARLPRCADDNEDLEIVHCDPEAAEMFLTFRVTTVVIKNGRCTTKFRYNGGRTPSKILGCSYRCSFGTCVPTPTTDQVTTTTTRKVSTATDGETRSTTSTRSLGTPVIIVPTPTIDQLTTTTNSNVSTVMDGLTRSTTSTSSFGTPVFIVMILCLLILLVIAIVFVYHKIRKPTPNDNSTSFERLISLMSNLTLTSMSTPRTEPISLPVHSTPEKSSSAALTLTPSTEMSSIQPLSPSGGASSDESRYTDPTAFRTRNRTKSVLVTPV